MTDSTFVVSGWCETLVPLIEDGTANRLLIRMIEQALGTIPRILYISQTAVLEKPAEGPSIPLSRLYETLARQGLDLSPHPESGPPVLSYMLGAVSESTGIPVKLRMDTVRGETRCRPLLMGYLNDAGTDLVDSLEANGAAAGFFCYPLKQLAEDPDAFREKLTAALKAGEGPEPLTLIGWATGKSFGYVDFIAWNFSETLRIADQFFRKSGLPWYAFQTFRPGTPAQRFDLPGSDAPPGEASGASAQ